MSLKPASTVDVRNFGCRLNIAEGENIRLAAGEAGADGAVIFNSCAVTDEAVRQSRQAVRRALRENPDRPIFVTGCAAELEGDRFAAMGATVVRNDAKGDAASYAGGVALPKIPAPYQPALSGADHARAFLGVQTGCSHSCTFCATVLARGTANSATADSVIAAARTALDRGQKEIILTGVDLASFGDDSQTSLADLVQGLLGLSGLERLRLSSLDPDRIDAPLFHLITGEARIMPHVHLSLQAGDDLILKRMKRRHSRAEAVDLVQRLKSARPEIAIGADLIAGFPTEDEAMFANSLALIDDCDIIFGHIFPYSPRAGTAAARMPQVARSIAKDRATQMRAANEKRRHRWLDAQIGAGVSMLVERDGQSGHAANFAPILLKSPAPAGSIQQVRLIARDGDKMIAERIAA